jgi:excisionase family DNA binding protein
VVANPEDLMVDTTELTRTWVTTVTAAQLHGLSRWTLWRWAQDGKVPSVRLGRDVLVDRHAVERLVRQRAIGV